MLEPTPKVKMVLLLVTPLVQIIKPHLVLLLVVVLVHKIKEHLLLLLQLDIKLVLHRKVQTLLRLV
jgi:hypothetical protein